MSHDPTIKVGTIFALCVLNKSTDHQMSKWTISPSLLAFRQHAFAGAHTPWQAIVESVSSRTSYGRSDSPLGIKKIFLF